MAKTSIEWTEHVWNPIRGCSRISEGCRNCYAERIAARFSANGETDQSGEVVLSAGPFAGFASMTPSGPRWTGKVELVPDALEIPLKRKKPTTYFVNSMSDLGHEALSDEDVYRVFAVMEQCRQHIFIVLTKRAQRMAKTVAAIYGGANMGYILPNVILGVSCEDQAAADERIPHLLATPAACRMVSLEPLLGPIDLERIDVGTLNALDGIDFEIISGPQVPAIDWVIVGGESGPGARPMHPDWARSLRDQCTAAAVPFFFKQHGEWMPIFTGIDPSKNDPRCRIHEGFTFPRNDGEKIGQHMWSVGKKVAGRLLDGCVWDERPEVLR